MHKPNYKYKSEYFEWNQLAYLSTYFINCKTVLPVGIRLAHNGLILPMLLNLTQSDVSLMNNSMHVKKDAAVKMVSQSQSSD